MKTAFPTGVEVSAGDSIPSTVAECQLSVPIIWEIAITAHRRAWLLNQNAFPHRKLDTAIKLTRCLINPYLFYLLFEQYLEIYLTRLLGRV